MGRARTTGLGLALALAALLPGPGGAAEESAKRELALELLHVAGGGEMAQQVSAIMLSSMRQSYSAMVGQLLASQPELTAEEKRAVEQRLSNFDRFAERYGARMNQEVDFDAVLEQAYVPLYEKYFTEAELRQILAFQKSPVGRKAATLMPRLMQEGMEATLPLIQPKLMALAVEILRDEQAIALRSLE